MFSLVTCGWLRGTKYACKTQGMANEMQVQLNKGEQTYVCDTHYLRHPHDKTP